MPPPFSLTFLREKKEWKIPPRITWENSDVIGMIAPNFPITESHIKQQNGWNGNKMEEFYCFVSARCFIGNITCPTCNPRLTDAKCALNSHYNCNVFAGILKDRRFGKSSAISQLSKHQVDFVNVVWSNRRHVEKNELGGRKFAHETRFLYLFLFFYSCLSPIRTAKFRRSKSSANSSSSLSCINMTNAIGCFLHRPLLHISSYSVA